VNWQIYIIRCSDETLYTGITTDIERRMREHAQGRGAKYFRGRQPVELLYLEGGHDRSSASRRELAIKKLKRDEKQALVASTAKLLQVALAADLPAAQFLPG
jgi:putative endonuclease